MTCHSETRELSSNRTQEFWGNQVNYYAHTAEDEEGKPLPEDSGKWQLLSAHLRNVADLAKKFASPLGLPAEAELAGLVNDFETQNHQT